MTHSDQIRAALEAARECIQIDRTSLADASMRADNTMAPEDAEALGQYDAVLLMVKRGIELCADLITAH